METHNVREARQYFSLRKFKFGLAPALLGCSLLFGGNYVNADEISTKATDYEPNTVKSLSSDDVTKTENEKTDVLESVPLVVYNAESSLSAEPFEKNNNFQSSVEENTGSKQDYVLNSKQNDNDEKIIPVLETNSVASDSRVELAKSTNLEGLEDSSKLLTTSLVIRKSEGSSLLMPRAMKLSMSITGSQARGDDYPAYLKNAAPDSVIDPWRLYNRECTSFTAYRLSSVNKFTLPPAYGHARQWGYRARNEGYRVDKTPAIGSVAWLDDGGYGHVAWVSDIVGDQVEIEEYNFNWTHNYFKRLLPISNLTGFIHFKDLSDVVTEKPVVTPSNTNNNTVSNSGTYYFTKRVGIKNEPKMASADVAYYDNGQSVNYDSTVIAENYKWISYLSASGTRRYIPIEVVRSAEKPNEQPVVMQKDTIPSSGTYNFKERSSVLAEPKKSSTELAYYSAGQSVFYDKLLDADGYKWISYIAGSGNRRYVPIQKLDSEKAESTTTTKPVENQPTKPNIPSAGSYTIGKRSSVKAEPKLNSTELAYYDSGSNVNYDRVLYSDGHYWISYIAGSGNRRYISIT